MMYENEYCKLVAFEEDHVVYFKWYQYCAYEVYREPLRLILKELSKNPGSALVIDARCGFEDEKEDVEWVFREFIPKLPEVGTQKVIFLTHVVNEIEGEIDMFTAEFMKYVQVEHSTSLADALSKC